MKENELVEFMFVFFAVGTIFAVYRPGVFGAVLPIVALLGAFYLVWGILSHVTSAFAGVGASRRDDWWNGIVILTVVVLVFGQTSLAVNAVTLMLSAIWRVFVGVFTLSL